MQHHCGNKYNINISVAKKKTSKKIVKFVPILSKFGIWNAGKKNPIRIKIKYQLRILSILYQWFMIIICRVDGIVVVQKLLLLHQNYFIYFISISMLCMETFNKQPAVKMREIYLYLYLYR